jgi:hypothetical protein
MWAKPDDELEGGESAANVVRDDWLADVVLPSIFHFVGFSCRCSRAPIRFSWVEWYPSLANWGTA